MSVLPTSCSVLVQRNKRFMFSTISYCTYDTHEVKMRRSLGDKTSQARNT